MEQVQAAVERTVLDVAKVLEDQLDNEIHRLENLDDDEMERLRQKRVLDLKKQREKAREWAAKGHGDYRHLLSEKEFFQEMKGEERMVCHFFRNNWPCQIMDKHLKILSQKHLETKFVKIDAEKSPYLTEKLRIFMLPTLALIKHEKTVDYVVGLDELGSTEDFSTEVLEERLAQAGVLHESSLCVDSRQKAAAKQTIKQSHYNKTGSDEDSDFE